MSKLPEKYQFVDLSDYGRFIARWIANSVKNTTITPIHITTLFIVSGLLAIVCMLYHYYFAAAFFLILKSILDAADGELARIKNTPSYTGRYYDSIADIILNFLFLLTFMHITQGWIVYMLMAFVGIQLQGTLYNYYYVILRNQVNGDTTSRIFEDAPPVALIGETQKQVNIMYKIYDFLYISFDKTIYFLDKEAMFGQPFPKWFMTLLSTFGLGFQILIMAIMLMMELQNYVIPFFICYSVTILLFVGIRKYGLS